MRSYAHVRPGQTKAPETSTVPGASEVGSLTRRFQNWISGLHPTMAELAIATHPQVDGMLP